jgi:hypothetical protein
MEGFSPLVVGRTFSYRFEARTSEALKVGMYLPIGGSICRASASVDEWRVHARELDQHRSLAAKFYCFENIKFYCFPLLRI